MKLFNLDTIIPFFLSISVYSFFVYFFNIETSLIRSGLIAYIGTVAGFLSFFFWFVRVDNSKNIIPVFTTPFFFMLLLLCFIFNLNTLLFTNLSEKIGSILIISTVCLGFITIYTHRKDAKQNIEEDEGKTVKSIKDGYLELQKKFPAISSIPVVKYVAKLIYQNGLLYSFATIALFIIGFAIRLYRLGDLSLWWDELTTGIYVNRILEIGIPLFPSELGYYWRGVAYHYLVSIFTFLFGNTEFWLRFPSVLFGMGTILLIFYYTKKINKIVALIALIFLVFSSYNIEYSRFARFYIMNEFLFVLSILIFYKGFFENKFKYKIISALLFFVMVHTVQLGAIFLSLITVWGLFFLKDIILIKEERKKYLRENFTNYIFIFIFLLIFYFDNIFSKILNISLPYSKAVDIGLATAPRTWNYVSLPQWQLFTFFNEHYLPLALILISLLFVAMIFLQYNKKTFSFFTFSGLSLFISILLYEIGSRGVSGPRIFLFAESLIVFITFISLYILLKSYTRNANISYAILGITTFFFILNINPFFYERIKINYGNDIIGDPFRSTSVASYRSDYKTTSKYVEKNYAEGDLIVTVVSPNLPYLKRAPDYTINQNIRWNTGALVNEQGEYISPSTNAVIINSSFDLEKIIAENKKNRIWLIVNGGSINILDTTHVRLDFLNFLSKNKDLVVYTSPDGISKVLLFNVDN